MRITGQLFKLSSNAFKVPYLVPEKGDVIKKAADNIPLLRWPDGMVCTIVNLFMLRCYKRNLSRKDNGGTLAKYADQISHLIRYCFNNMLDFYDMTDSHFTMFIRNLQAEVHKKRPGQKRRSPEQVRAIGKVCLDFLNFVGDLFGNVGFVSLSGTIKAEYRSHKIKTENRDEITRYYWHHHSFPFDDANDKRLRLPISKIIIELLNSVIPILSNSTFLKRRRFIMILLYEITGARRIEIVNIKVQDVYSALNMIGDKQLRVITAKKRGGFKERYIPVAVPDLEELKNYIEKYRNRIIRNTIGIESDHGYLLISETTGERLSTRTLSNEIRALAMTAGVEQETCGHMFRHRYITKLFILLINRHNFKNKDAFRKALIDIESIKAEIKEHTGHSTLKSLDRYICLAFDEISGFGETLNAVKARNVIDSFNRTVANINNRIDEYTSASDIGLELKKCAAATIEALNLCLTTDETSRI